MVTPAHVGLPSTEPKEAKASVPQILCSYWDLEEFLENKFLRLLYAFEDNFQRAFHQLQMFHLGMMDGAPDTTVLEVGPPECWPLS